MKCHNCEAELPDDARFCPQCGEKQGPSKQAILSEDEIAKIRARAETDEYLVRLRKTVADGLQVEIREAAVLFVDVSGFTAMFGMLSPEQIRSVMREVYAVMTEAIVRCDGRVNKFIGDEVMALFGAPIALERPCDRAIAAVDEIKIGLAGVNHRFRGILLAPLSVHAGIAFGKVQVGRLGDSKELEYSVLGQTVNLAKRLTDAAPSEAVFVSKRVAHRARDRYEFQSLTEQQFAGVKKPTEVFRLIGPRSTARGDSEFAQFNAPMFGRDEELGKLRSALQDLLACNLEPKPDSPIGNDYQGYSRIFSITGESGVGKSRLKREFGEHLNALLGEGKYRFLEGSTWGIGQTPPYWTIKMQIASGLGFDLNASNETVSKALFILAAEMANDNELIPYLFYLFGVAYPQTKPFELEPSAVKDNLWIAIRRLYGRWALEKPLVLVFEDMHWADGGTVDFVEYLAEFVNDIPIIVLLLHRPKFGLRLASKKGIPFTEIALTALSASDEQSLLEFYIHSGSKERTLIRRLADYSDGNPLFIEECLSLLIEEGKLELKAGKMRLVKDVGKMPLPTGLSEVMAERIDRLSQREKRTAYYGAVIGRSFLHSLLSDVHGALHDVEDIREPIEALQRRGIIFTKVIEPELEYLFKHAVTREILVSRLVESLRRELSRLVALSVEKRYQDQIGEFHGLLSEHWETAGEIEKAARHASLWGIFNQKQNRVFEAQAAFTRYQRLAERLDHEPLSDSERADLLDSRIAVSAVLGCDEEALALCDTLGGMSGGRYKAGAIRLRAELEQSIGDYENSWAHAQQALDMARKTSNRAIEAQALTTKGNVHYYRADYEGALDCYEAAHSIFRELGDRFCVAGVLNNIASVYFDRGDYDRSLQYDQEALSIRREIDDRRGAAVSLHNLGEQYQRRCDYDDALAHYEEALCTFRTLGDSPNTAMVLEGIGTVHRLCGNHEESLRKNTFALAMERELGNKLGIASALCNIGEVHHELGDIAEASKHYQEALEMSRALGDRSLTARLLGRMADLLVDNAQFQESLEAANEARSIASEIGVSSIQALSLAALCRAHAGLGAFKKCLAAGHEALHIADEAGESEQRGISRLAMADVHLRLGRWCNDEQEAEAPPLSREDAVVKAADYANQAKALAEAKGMKGLVKKANELLARIGDFRAEPD
ncbi:MAG: tetratricopeptide repeat protein [Candidatus Coatesbacteria bacterium]|nr:tetratricopeptide repeat protein [Candidatus Coatesbacteria bacterium]